MCLENSSTWTYWLLPKHIGVLIAAEHMGVLIAADMGVHKATEHMGVLTKLWLQSTWA